MARGERERERISIKKKIELKWIFIWFDIWFAPKWIEMFDVWMFYHYYHHQTNIHHSGKENNSLKELNWNVTKFIDSFAIFFFCFCKLKILVWFHFYFWKEIKIAKVNEKNTTLRFIYCKITEEKKTQT